MPYRVFNADEVAQYLHLTRADIDALVKDHAIPFHTRGNRVVFYRQEIDAWASQRILGMQGPRLTEYHRQSARGTRELFPNEAVLPELLQPQFIAPALAAKTKASVLREMVALAESTGRVNGPRELLQSLLQREELCSTGLPGGLALLHPRHHEPYMFEASFIALGRTLQEIPFGAPDRQATDLFFLICCQDDRIHLHTLARICLLAHAGNVLPSLRQAPDASAMFECIIAAERDILRNKRQSGA
ncbi:MAG: PTS sugar transporter subunit IIA [Verrucomicrobia bacterium]|nr:PTS sugar transporter subunit IIA [Verrucomicrobiota bacterium]